MDIESSVGIIREVGAMTIIAIAVLAALRWAIPALFAYIKEKDTAHREEMIKIVTDCREERETFYKTLRE